MKERRFLTIALFAILFLLLHDANAQNKVKQDDKPNVLLIVGDDIGYGEGHLQTVVGAIPEIKIPGGTAVAAKDSSSRRSAKLV